MIEPPRSGRHCHGTAADAAGRSIRSIRSGRASAARRRTWSGASRNSPPSSIRPSCITTRLKRAIVYRLSERLDHPAFSGELIRQAYAEALNDMPAIGEASAPTCGDGRPRSGDPSADRAGALLQGLSRHPDASADALAVGQGPPRFRALSAKPRLGGVPVRHPSGRAYRPRHFPRSRHRPRGRRNRGDRRRCVDAARRDARRHRQGTRRPPSENPLWRDDRRRRQDFRQYRGRPLRAHRRRLGGASSRCRTTSRSPAFRPRSSASPAARSPRGPWIRCFYDEV